MLSILVTVPALIYVDIDSHRQAQRPRSSSSEPMMRGGQYQTQQPQQQGGMQYIGVDGYRHVLPAQTMQEKPYSVCCAMCT